MASPAVSNRLPPSSRPTPRSNPNVFTPASGSSPLAPSLSSQGLRTAPSPAYGASISSKAGKSPYTVSALNRTVAAVTSAANTPNVMATGPSPASGTGLTPAFVGIGTMMGLGVSLDAGTGVRDQEAERQRKTEDIVRLLSRKWGRVSREGVERCAKRVGLECLWEEGIGSRTLSIAGNGVLIDVEFQGDVVYGSTLSLLGSSEKAGETAAKGAEILRRDLQREKGRYRMLDDFADNLDRLARLDKLSNSGLSCFDAVQGIYGCLQTVFEWEITQIGLQSGKEAGLEVMCERGGRPEMYSNKRVGLSLQYWKERRYISGTKRKAEEMDIDSKEDDAFDEREGKLWSMVIECEASSAQTYPSIRVSDAWVSNSVHKAGTVGVNQVPLDEPQIDWQEPPLTLVSPSNPIGDSTKTNTGPLLTGRPPDVRFIARFEPPVIVLLQTALEIHQLVGHQLQSETMQYNTYESLLFQSKHKADTPINEFAQRRTTERTITSFDNSKQSTEHHYRFTLATQPQDLGFRLEQIPFSHPNQLIALLPTLRQYALLGSILHRTFSEAKSEQPKATTDAQKGSTSPIFDDTFDDDMLTSGPARNAISINISLSLTPIPQLMVMLQHKEALKTISFAIGANGEIQAQDLAQTNETKGMCSDDLTRLAKVMSIGEDIGVLAAWMQR